MTTNNPIVIPDHSDLVHGATTCIKDKGYPCREDIAYLLPDHNEEDARLDKQHHLVKLVFGGSFDSPVKDALEQGITVLDSGCGTGSFACELGKEYPNSKIHGIDISLRVPEAIRPPNCEFHVHNIIHDPIFPDNHFDFIHQRLLTLALSSSDWKRVVATLMRQLKPGGWIELAETVISPCENGGPRMNLLLDGIAEYSRKTKNIDFGIAMKLDSLLRDAGAINISTHKVFLPFNHSGEVGRLTWDNFKIAADGMKPWIIKIRPELEDPKSYEKFIEECAEECKENKTGVYTIRCYGQKPSTTSGN